LFVSVYNRDNENLFLRNIWNYHFMHNRFPLMESL